MRHHLKLAVAPALLAAACTAPATEQVWTQCPPAGVELQDCVFPGIDLVGSLSDNAQVLNDLCNTPCRNVDHLIIGVDFDSLRDVKPLSRIEKVVHRMTVTYNPTLKDLQGLETVKAAGEVFIRNNPELLSLRGLDNLNEAISIDIDWNPKITQIGGLSSLARLSDLSIYSNNELVDISSLSSLKSAFTVLIDRNKGLQKLDGLQALSSITRAISISENESLRSLDAVKNVRAVYRNAVVAVADNPHLPQCEALAFAEAIPAFDTEHVSGNDMTATCDSQQ